MKAIITMRHSNHSMCLRMYMYIKRVHARIAPHACMSKDMYVYLYVCVRVYVCEEGSMLLCLPRAVALIVILKSIIK